MRQDSEYSIFQRRIIIIINKNRPLLVLTLVATSGLTACAYDGADNTGEQIDKVISDAANALEDACENAKEDMSAKNEDC
ncbi:hypothetical protein ACPUVO_03425 [Pseudocolwellia sp. HL-MZ19]|uniref:hypothetical protein n=1 Tax=unclassified Pseudocolwellia TaxID=2848178 RepID=UPI003CE938E4